MSGPIQIGSLYEESLPILGSRVPLRPGSWQVLAHLRGASTTSLTARSFLGRIENGRLQEAVDVYTAVSSSDRPERYGGLMLHENELYRSIEANEDSASQSSCTIRNMITWPWLCFQDRTTGLIDVEAAAAETMARLGIGFPAEFLLTTYVRREQFKFLQVGYYFSPEAAGLPLTAGELPTWRDSEFAPLRIRKDPRKFAYYRTIIDWAEQHWPRVKSCFELFSPEGF